MGIGEELEKGNRFCTSTVQLRKHSMLASTLCDQKLGLPSNNEKYVTIWATLSYIKQINEDIKVEKYY